MNNEFVSLVLIDSDDHTIGTINCKSPEQFRKDIEKYYPFISTIIFNTHNIHFLGEFIDFLIMSEEDIKNVTQKAKTTAINSIDKNKLRDEGHKQLLENLNNIDYVADSIAEVIKATA